MIVTTSHDLHANGGSRISGRILHVHKLAVRVP